MQSQASGAGARAPSLIQSLRQIDAQCRAVDSLFNFVTDPDLVEYCILEQNALRVQRSYLLRELKRERAAARVEGL